MKTSPTSRSGRPAWLSSLAARLSADSKRSSAKSSRRPDEQHRTTVMLWLLTAACAAYWGWAVWAGHLPGAAPATLPAITLAPAPVLEPPAELARLLGARDNVATAPSPAQRFMVWGVIADARGQGAALIGVDGQAPKPFAVGAELAPGWVLQSLGPREVRLAETVQGPVRLTLPLPQPSLPPPSAAASSAAEGTGAGAGAGVNAPAPQATAPPLAPIPPEAPAPPLPPGVGPPDLPSSRGPAR